MVDSKKRAYLFNNWHIGTSVISAILVFIIMAYGLPLVGKVPMESPLASTLFVVGNFFAFYMIFMQKSLFNAEGLRVKLLRDGDNISFFGKLNEGESSFARHDGVFKEFGGQDATFEAVTFLRSGEKLSVVVEQTVIAIFSENVHFVLPQKQASE